MVSKIVIVAFLAISLSAFSEGLKCYTCNGPIGSDCAKGELATMAVQICSESANSCASTDITGAWVGRSISRGCQIISCERLRHAQDIGVNQCKTCTQDLCNTDDLSVV